MNLGQAVKYFDWMKQGKMKKSAIFQISKSLSNHLWRFVFTSNLVQIYDVPDKASMRKLIKARSFPPLTRYSASYLARMRREGRVSHGSLRQKTHIEAFNDKVLFYIPRMNTQSFKITKAGKVNWFNYGPVHEKRKSILKSTVVFAWADILTRIGKIYTNFAKSA
jgi:hypothetical protein